MSRSLRYDHLGDPKVLYLTEVSDEAPRSGEVAVRVRAAGLNPFDAKVRAGVIPSDAPFPRAVGSDLAGTVESVGDGAEYWDGTPVRVGDEVLGRGTGSVAELIVTPAAVLTRRPEALPVEVAGGLYVAGLTAVSCLATVPISARDTVLVGGASGAVGMIVAQLARRVGASVIGSTSSRNAELLRSLGVAPVPYGNGLAERVAALGKPTAVIDCHGREALDTGVKLGVPVKRMVAIADHSAVSELGVHNVERKARTAQNLAVLAEEVASGRVVVRVAATFALDEVASAFTMLESSHTPGKIIVLPGEHLDSPRPSSGHGIGSVRLTVDSGLAFG